MFIGDQEIKAKKGPVVGEYVDINGESYFKISNYDKMLPFLMSIVSYSDHWMFISSKGGLTAGRKNPDNALLPYYTDDIIHTAHETTGSKTILKIHKGSKTYLWEPFSECQKNIYNTQCNIYKNIPCNKIIFEEVNIDLGICFSYSWLTSEKYGFIKKSEIINNSDENISIDVLDGIQNILPYGIYQKFQTELSTLGDGYKKNELIDDLSIGIYTLSSIPSDKAEPSESLMATTVWSIGLDINKHLLSSRQLYAYRSGTEISQEDEVKGSRGSFFINSNVKLNSSNKIDWLIISEINQDLSSVVKIKNLLKSNHDIKKIVLDDVNDGTEKLVKIVASADGLQVSRDKLATSRHFSNVLFNVMRGGIFDDAYWVQKKDLILFLQNTNKELFIKYNDFLNSLDKRINYSVLKKIIEKLGDTSLTKLSLEYLPLTFSRRHGDPSRPWNRFSIDLKNEYDEKILNYEGNWRDIFQNWEALAISFPEYLESMISKFLNASTADGYNPYRVTRTGFDWEAPEEDTPWANIGYWGDHQIIYLLKLLELSHSFNSSVLISRITSKIYSYANVPYRIKSYDDLLKDPQNTIEFDYELHNRIIEREKEIGTDARFLTNKEGIIYQVNLAEKLILTLLTKLSNFVAGAGIWMNTQRPEWNDANNALVGNGVSMVTLYYIRRYLTFCIKLFSKLEIASISLSEEIVEYFEKVRDTFKSNEDILTQHITDINRKSILDELGLAGEVFRNKIYKNGFSCVTNDVKKHKLVDFFNLVRDCIDFTIMVNKREDNLYHSYNLMTVKENKIIISHLYEMLEGQVAVISSGYLTVSQVNPILDALYHGKLYRDDQNSFILYPDRELPKFVDKNYISKELFSLSKLLQKLVEINNRDIIIKDEDGNYHFNGEIKNAQILRSRLQDLSVPELRSLVELEEEKILEIYEEIFNHKSFTGRSGTFYKYEGLGCIYWHMVSKLVLAVNESYYEGIEKETDTKQLDILRDYYYLVKEGVGLHKSPANYGAFPTDPYSHTPSFAGVQQPGLTGQVKEDILSRFGEFGLQFIDGDIYINPLLLNTEEFTSYDDEFIFYDVSNEKNVIPLSKNSIAFTLCQVPFIYSKGNKNSITITKNNDKKIIINKLVIDKTLSRSIFKREAEIKMVNVTLIPNT